MAAEVTVAQGETEAVAVWGAVLVEFAVAVAEEVWMIEAVAHDEAEAVAEGEAVAEVEKIALHVGQPVGVALLLAAAVKEGCEAVAEAVAAPLFEGAEVPDSALEALMQGEELADGEALLDAKALLEVDSDARGVTEGAEGVGGPVTLSRCVGLSPKLLLTERLGVAGAVMEKREEAEGAEGEARGVVHALGDDIDAEGFGDLLVLGEGLNVEDDKAEREVDREPVALPEAETVEVAAAAAQEAVDRGALPLPDAERVADRQRVGEAQFVEVPGALVALPTTLTLAAREVVPADQDPLRLRVVPPEPLTAATVAVILPTLAVVLSEAPPLRLLDAVLVELGVALTSTESVGAADVDACNDPLALSNGEMVGHSEDVGDILVDGLDTSERVLFVEGVAVTEGLRRVLGVRTSEKPGEAEVDTQVDGEALGLPEDDSVPLAHSLAKRDAVLRGDMLSPIVVEKSGVPEADAFAEADGESEGLPLAESLTSGLVEGAALPEKTLPVAVGDGDGVVVEVKERREVALLLGVRVAETVVDWMLLPRDVCDELLEELLLLLGVDGSEGLAEGLPEAVALLEKRNEARTIEREGMMLALLEGEARALLQAEELCDAVKFAVSEKMEAVPLALPVEHALRTPLRVKHALAVGSLLREEEGLPPKPLDTLLDALAAPEGLWLLELLPEMLIAELLAVCEGVPEKLAKLALPELEGAALAEARDAETELLCTAEVVETALFEKLGEAEAVAV